MFWLSAFAAWELGVACRACEEPQAAQVPRERPQARARAGGERTSLEPPRQCCKSRAAEFCTVLTVPQSTSDDRASSHCRECAQCRACSTEYGGVRQRTVLDNTGQYGGEQYYTVPQSTARCRRHAVSLRIGFRRDAEAVWPFIPARPRTHRPTLRSPTLTHPPTHTYTPACTHARRRTSTDIDDGYNGASLGSLYLLSFLS